ncbi:MAG TPA: hypothetical protein VF434_08525 [Promineifilum sp.]
MRLASLAGLGVALSLAGCFGDTAGNNIAGPTLLPAPTSGASAVVEALPEVYPPAGNGLPPAESPAAYPPLPASPATLPVSTKTTTPEDQSARSTPATSDEIFMPLVGQGQPIVTAGLIAPTTTPVPATPTSPPTAMPAISVSPTPIHVLDFGALGDQLGAQGRQLAYNKIGFHVTFLEDRDELDGWMKRLDSEGVPFFLKSVDNAEPLFRAQELMKESGVPHTLVYRSTLYDVPDYEMDPILAAEHYWELEKEIWPPELDPAMVWFETMNELDKNRSEWLAQFALRTAQLALQDGYKWAAFGWASGEPEPGDWESPAMLELLRLIGENPDRLGIALHEYSYLADDIGHEYPHKVGRFLDLFAAADKHGIPRPTVLITEWGWTYNNIPPEPLAMEDVAWAARLYGAYPEVLGAAIWNLGILDGKVLPLNSQMRDLIDNMLAISLDSYFSAPQWPQQAPLDAGQFPPPDE